MCLIKWTSKVVAIGQPNILIRELPATGVILTLRVALFLILTLRCCVMHFAVSCSFKYLPYMELYFTINLIKSLRLVSCIKMYSYIPNKSMLICSVILKSTCFIVLSNTIKHGNKTNTMYFTHIIIM